MTEVTKKTGDNGSMTLWCNVSNLDYQEKNLYFWKWKFNENAIQENGKYNMSYNVYPPVVCLQSNGSMSLRIKNFSKQDFGQYKCAVLRSSTTLVEEDVNIWDTGMTQLWKILIRQK